MITLHHTTLINVINIILNFMDGDALGRPVEETPFEAIGTSKEYVNLKKT